MTTKKNNDALERLKNGALERQMRLNVAQVKKLLAEKQAREAAEARIEEKEKVAKKQNDNQKNG